MLLRQSSAQFNEKVLVFIYSRFSFDIVLWRHDTFSMFTQTIETQAYRKRCAIQKHRQLQIQSKTYRMRNEICIPEFQTRTQNSTSYTRRQESSLDQRHSYLSDDQRKLAQLVRNCFTVKLTSSRNVCFHSVQITSLRACRLEQRSLSRGR